MNEIDETKKEAIDVESNQPKNIIPDYTVAKLAGWGVGGFIFGCILLFYSDFSTPFTTDSIFHEIVYNPRLFGGNVITKAIDSFENLIANKRELIKINQDTINVKSPVLKTDTNAASIINRLNTANKKLENDKEIDTNKVKLLSNYKKYYEDVSETDSLGFKELNKVLHFSIKGVDLDVWDSIYSIKAYSFEKQVEFYFKNPDLKMPERIGGIANFTITRAKSDVAFIGKYPSAGIWVLLIMVFSSVSFLSIVISINQKLQIEKIFKDQEYGKVEEGRYWKICMWTLGVLSFLIVVWQNSFFDDRIVKNIFFTKNLVFSMNGIIGLGILAGTLCIAGFIYTASMLSFFARPLTETRKAVKQKEIKINQIKSMALATDEPTLVIAENQQALVNEQAKESMEETIFNKLTIIFQNYFMLSAIILSMIVLCTGTLFATINSLDFIKLLADDWGYSPARSDFVYFYGALFTIILLMVYVPAKIRFSEVDVWKTNSIQGNNKFIDIVKNPFGPIKDLLVATSPLLVSVIQSLFELLFK